jgi:prepilin-type N-terminal cleavage/methylation domain-containing protein/prepilin-type processing-associated H-X9-DG protein
MSQTRTPRRAFTLIELLVVIAIIAILAAILFPVFAQARGKARQTSSLSNTKQLSMAFQMYAQDYDEMVVPNYWPGSNAADAAPGCTRPSRPGNPDQPCTAQVPGWPMLLQPYQKNWGLVRCASVSDPWGIYGDPTFNWWFNWARFANYGYNWVYLSPSVPGVPGGQLPVSLAAVGEPAATVAYVDSAINLGTASAPNYRAGYIVTDPPTGAGAGAVYWFGGWNSVRPDPRHSDGANVAWFDGHSKWSKLDQLKNNTLWDLQ